MDLDDCKERVKIIASIVDIYGDEEAAHSEEDSLYVDFVKHVAINEHGELACMAKKILETKNIVFDRWCA